MKDETKNLIKFYETLSLETLDNLSSYYHDKCYFKDPFHELETCEELKAIYLKMFKNLKNPKFKITNSFEKDRELVLFWDFTFNDNFLISGSTHFIYDEHMKITKHIDYWDSVRELWAKIPVLRNFIKLFYKTIS